MKMLATSQKVSGVVFLAGIGAFFYFGQIMLAKHTAWTEFQTPAGMGDVFGLFASVTAAIGGALGLNLTNIFRAWSGTQNTRFGDFKGDN